MAAPQEFLPTSAVAHPSGSRAPMVALTGLALVALVGSLAWLGPRSGAQSPEQTTPGTFTTYGVSGSSVTVSSPYDSPYPAAAAGTSVTITSASAEAAKAKIGAGNMAVNQPGGSVYDSQVPAAARSASAAWPGSVYTSQVPAAARSATAEWPGPHQAQGD